MRYLLFLALALASCATTKQGHNDTPLAGSAVKLQQSKTATDSAFSAFLESDVKVQGIQTSPKRRLFGLLPPARPGKIKNSTINIQLGNGNTAATATKPGTMATGAGATATDAQKADAPVQVGQGNQATDNSKAGQRGGAAATGEGSSATATTQKQSWLSAVLPWVAGVLGAYSLLPFLPVPGAGWLIRLFAYRRRDREPETG